MTAAPIIQIWVVSSQCSHCSRPVNISTTKVTSSHTMAVDLSMKSDSNNNNAVDLSISRSDTENGIARSSENTMQIVEKLMEARKAVNMTECDKTNIEMTALNLLCLARLQEILQPAPASLSPPLPVQQTQTQPCNRKLYKCDYSDCTKVRQ